jgi:hypothetical protein
LRFDALTGLEQRVRRAPKDINFCQPAGGSKSARKAGCRKAFRPKNELWPANRFAGHSLVPSGMIFPLMAV